MGWKRLFAAVLAGAGALAGAPSSTAQDAPAPAAAPKGEAAAPETEADRAERLARARARWETLSPGERDRLLRAYEEWRRFSEEKRESLRRRFESVGGREGADLVGKRLEEMRRQAPDRLARMRMQKRTLERLVDRLVEGAPERARQAFEALPPEGRERVRHRVGHGLLALGRETMLQRHATEAEKEALRSGDAKRKEEASRAVLQRAADAVLAPRREELAALPEAERRQRKAEILEEAFWSGVRERGEEIRGALGKALQESAHGDGRDGGGGREGGRHGEAGRRPMPELRERFTRRFGVAPEDLGDARAVRALVHAAALVPEEGREAFYESVRPELQRIRALPAPEKGPALKALLERLR